MTDTTSPLATALKPLKWVLILNGVIATLVGIVMFFAPGASMLATTILVAIYTIINGVLNIVGAITARTLSMWPRVGLAVVGALFIVTGVFAFMHPGPTAILLAVLVMTMLAIAWIAEGVVALTALKEAPSKGWAIFFAIVSILGGIALLMQPMFATVVIWLWLGISLVVIGVTQIVRGVQLGRR